ncbi:MAG: MBOAT family protein [Flavobacteriales bacterium]|nr:MBOAT family protein [Flavobacteriales bacterium]
MLFNSFAFLVFLPVVFVAYWWLFAGRVRARNLFLLGASWFFYGWWDWRFLGLIIVSSLADFLIGPAIHRSGDPRHRRWLLVLSIAINLGILGFFKYFNFFIGGFAALLETIGLQAHLPVLRIVLPVGISFYTFQTLSYTIDIHRGLIRPTRDAPAFFAFVAFFPQLVAGPIERARDLLPQFGSIRRFDLDSARDGLRQMLWGFFKKIAIADTCAPIVNDIFAGAPADTPGITLFFGAFFFAFQIYGDFSGYSDMAIGMARLFGFNLSRNFAYPYFSRGIGEFWRRWHITLSSWFRDYVYIPLGGWRGRGGRMRNILVTFAVSGLWHGANWNFIGWGTLHGLYHAPAVWSDRRSHRDDAVLRDLPRILGTFLLVTLTWVFFRATGMEHAVSYLQHMAVNVALHPGALLLHLVRPELFMIAAMLIVEWRARHHPHALVILPASTPFRWAIYLLILTVILLHLDLHTSREFIYFQF